MDALERGNLSKRGLRLADHLPNIAERVIEKLIRHQVDIEEKQFVFTSECGTANVIFNFR